MDVVALLVLRVEGDRAVEQRHHGLEAALRRAPRPELKP
jgi:hypothetical protein